VTPSSVEGPPNHSPLRNTSVQPVGTECSARVRRAVGRVRAVGVSKRPKPRHVGRIRVPMGTLCSVSVLISTAVLLAVAGCSSLGTIEGRQPPASHTTAPGPVAPGVGFSFADSVYRAAGLETGQVLVYMSKEGTESRSATTRVKRAAESNPEWAYAESFARRGNQQVFAYKFTDSSSLALVGRGALESVEITRP
jgi:hypothetical protein